MTRDRFAKHRVIALLPARIECSGSLYLDGKGIEREYIPAREKAPGSQHVQRLVLTERRPSMYEDTYEMRDGMTCFMTFYSEVTNRIPNPYLLNPFTPEETARIQIRWQPHLESVRWRKDGDAWIATFDGRDAGGYGPAEGGGARWNLGDVEGTAEDLDAAESAFVDAWAASIYAMVGRAAHPIVEEAA